MGLFKNVGECQDSVNSFLNPWIAQSANPGSQGNFGLKSRDSMLSIAIIVAFLHPLWP